MMFCFEQLGNWF